MVRFRALCGIEPLPAQHCVALRPVQSHEIEEKFEEAHPTQKEEVIDDNGVAKQDVQHIVDDGVKVVKQLSEDVQSGWPALRIPAISYLADTSTRAASGARPIRATALLPERGTMLL